MYEENSKGDLSLIVTAKGDLKANSVFREKVVPDDLPSRVNAVGYIDPNKRIKQMIEAGIRIDAWNQALYDFERGVEQDDGISMAIERNDWDDLDMLTQGAREKALYELEMYKYYSSALKSQKDAQEASQVHPEANEKESVKTES